MDFEENKFDKIIMVKIIPLLNQEKEKFNIFESGHKYIKKFVIDK